MEYRDGPPPFLQIRGPIDACLLILQIKNTVVLQIMCCDHFNTHADHFNNAIFSKTCCIKGNSIFFIRVCESYISLSMMFTCSDTIYVHFRENLRYADET